MKIINVKGMTAEQLRDAGVTYCGRPSTLGNPYEIRRDGDRDKVIGLYRRWLWCRMMARDKAVLEALGKLTAESVLGCWCSPRRCHCEVIARAWAWQHKVEAVVEYV